MSPYGSDTVNFLKIFLPQLTFYLCKVQIEYVENYNHNLHHIVHQHLGQWRKGLATINIFLPSNKIDIFIVVF